MKRKQLFYRTILISAFLISSSCWNNAIAQINFEHGTWAEIKAKAKAENKIIFMDAYTSWCGPCKWMANTVFTNDTVAKYFNASFICTKFDMEKGEGKELAKKFNVHYYPSLLFIDANGEIVHRAVGSRSTAEFVQLGKDAQMPEKQFVTFEKKYKGGQRDVKFIKSYLDVLSSVYLETKEPLAAYLKTQKEEDLLSRENWQIMYEFLDDFHSKEFAYLLKNVDAFAKKYTADSVNDKLFNVYSDACNKLIYAKKVKKEDYFKLKEEIKKTGFSRAEELLLSTDMNYYKQVEDYENYAKAAALFLDKYNKKNPNQLNDIAWTFYEKVKDKAMLAKAEQWAQQLNELAPDEPAFMDTHACLLFATGKKAEAVKLEKQALEIVKAHPETSNASWVTDFEKNITEWSK